MEKKIALTAEQNTKRLLFIGKCVDENLTIPNYTKFGVEQRLTVQDLSVSSDKTLEGIYVAIQKQVNESSLGLKASKTVEISGVPATEWLDFIKLTVQNREYKVDKATKKAEAQKLQAELDTMKSPTQKKRELQKKLDELNAE